MSETSNTGPNLGVSPSSLDELIRKALRRYGDFAPETAEGELALMFVELANLVIDEIRSHPYWDGSPLSYYEHQTDIRDIPDNVMIAGLLAQYALQQGSPKAGTLVPLYYRTLNQALLYRSVGNTKFKVRPVDGGSRLSESPRTDMRTGQPAGASDE